MYIKGNGNESALIYDSLIGINTKTGSDVEYTWKIGVCTNKTEIEGFRHISFVNGTPTPDGGTHVDYIVKMITKSLCDIANKKRESGGKVKEIDIKNNMFLFLMCDIDKPSFTSQSKEKLGTIEKNFGSKIELNEKFIKRCATKTDIIELAISVSQFKENKKLKNTDGKKVRDIGFIPKLIDANLAGGTRSSECTLILTEGDSAMTSVVSALSIIGRDRYGVFPLKGKLLNVREKSIDVITKNDEIQNIKKIIGLKNYTDYSKDINGLRYGKIMIITDADVDGIHIRGLIINFIDYYWKGLIKRGDFIVCMATPILKVLYKSRGKNNNSEKFKSIEFYSAGEFEEWKKDNSI